MALGSINGLPVAGVPGEGVGHPMKREVCEAFKMGNSSLAADDLERLGTVTGWGEWVPNFVDQDVESGTSRWVFGFSDLSMHLPVKTKKEKQRLLFFQCNISLMVWVNKG